MPTPKKRYLDSTPAVAKQQLAKMNKQANARERNIAKAYLEAGPNIVNLAKAAYHWYNSVPWLGGKDENGNILVTGEVPTPGMRNPKSIAKGIRGLKNSKSIVKGVRPITKANAQKITSKQWTAAQDAAIARGDMVEAQRLRDLHFKVNAPNTQIIDKNGNPIHSYHGTGKRFNEFDTTGKYSTLDEGYYGKGAYFAPNKELAQIYADTEKTPVIYDTYLNIKNPLRHVRDENADLYGKVITGNDGVISKLPDDLVDETFDMTEYVATKPNQIKLADAVTYDNNGVRIPLGERDNFKLNDIRYGLIPIIGGGIGYGLYNKKSNKNKNIR